MKMIFAGTSGTPEAVLYNCTRNVRCQRPYYVPLPDLSDLMLYFDFPFGKPATVTLFATTCNSDTVQLTFENYVIGQKTDGDWYGVFTQCSTPAEALQADRFYIRAMVTDSANTYNYYTNQFEFEKCAALTELTGCYNDTDISSNATDCNGVYYGFPAGTDTLGNDLLRYYHSAFVRSAEVIESRNKFQFSYFNNKVAYKNFLTKNYLLRFELVPPFYKDEIIAAMNRGNISINGKDYRLEDAQEIALTNDDLKWWKMDLVLTELCKQFFSCTPTVCTPAPMPPPVMTCTDNFTDATVTLVSGNNYHFDLTGGTLEAGDSIAYEVRKKADNTLLASGTVTTNGGDFTAALSLSDTCYFFRWQKVCANDAVTAWTQEEFGNCTVVPPPDSYGCDDSGQGTWDDMTYHKYDPFQISTTGLTHIHWNCYDRPNRFTIFDNTTGGQIITTGWVGNADYAGIWGSSLSTPESGTFDYTPEAGHTYRLEVETGGGDPVTQMNDAFDFYITCEPPPDAINITYMAAFSTAYNSGLDQYDSIDFTVNLDAPVTVTTTFVLEFDTVLQGINHNNNHYSFIMNAGEAEKTITAAFANNQVFSPCLFSVDNTAIVVTGWLC